MAVAMLGRQRAEVTLPEGLGALGHGSLTPLGRTQPRYEYISSVLPDWPG